MVGPRRSVPLTRSFAAACLVVMIATSGVACVEVPDNIRAHFADPRADERSNYRPGLHGSAPPNEDAPQVATNAAPAAPATTEPQEPAEPAAKAATLEATSATIEGAAADAGSAP